MKIDKGFEKLDDLMGRGRKRKPPAYQWQELALRVINELGMPNKKRSAVFKVCKENNKNFIERCLNDTKELCHTGQCWKYFFKLISAKN
jgi:hypothetical protein